jgi:hypothetical protein
MKCKNMLYPNDKKYLRYMAEQEGESVRWAIYHGLYDNVKRCAREAAGYAARLLVVEERESMKQ